MEIEEKRKAPTSLKDYLRGSKESADVFRWIIREVMTKESTRWLKNMIGALIAMVAIQGVLPCSISYIFNGLTIRYSEYVFWGLGIFFICLVIQKIFQCLNECCREWCVGLNWGRLNFRVTELFFEKSLAQHVHDGNMLSPTTIEKGKTKILDIQRTLLFNGFSVILQLLTSWILLFFLNWVAGIIMTIVLITYILWSLYLNYKIAEVMTPVDRDFRRIERRRNERWENVERVKVSGKEIVENKEMSSIFDDVLKVDRNFWLHFIKLAFFRSLVNITGLVMVMSWGAWLVWDGRLSVGLLYPLYAWAMRLSENIWQFADIELMLNWHMPAIKSMIKAITIPPSIVDAPDAIEIDSTIPHTIVFDNVSHSYPVDKKKDEEDLPAIQKINFEINPGQKVAILGSSGSGKSTLERKVLRFDDPTSGTIFIDGVDLRNITQASWKKGIGYIPQQAQVLDGSIKYNLTYGLTDEEKSKITDDDLWNLMKLLKIDFGNRLTDGLETKVGKNGMKLSGGQAQRLMIGAAVIKKPWLLIIDEATSSLDSTTEKQVHEGLKTILTGSKTSALIVAHRLSTVRDLCDTFVVLKSIDEVKNGDSQVEAIANSFEELYDVSPTFRQLADDQGIKIR